MVPVAITLTKASKEDVGKLVTDEAVTTDGSVVAVDAKGDVTLEVVAENIRLGVGAKISEGRVGCLVVEKTLGKSQATSVVKISRVSTWLALKLKNSGESMDSNETNSMSSKYGLRSACVHLQMILETEERNVS